MDILSKKPKNEKEDERTKRLIKYKAKQAGEHMKYNSPQKVFGTTGKFLEATETLLRYLMIPFFILGISFGFAGGVIGPVFVGLGLFCFCAAKISAFSFKDDFKDEADLLQNDSKHAKLIEAYQQSVEKVLTLKSELEEIRNGKLNSANKDISEPEANPPQTETLEL